MQGAGLHSGLARSTHVATTLLTTAPHPSAACLPVSPPRPPLPVSKYFERTCATVGQPYKLYFGDTCPANASGTSSAGPAKK